MSATKAANNYGATVQIGTVTLSEPTNIKVPEPELEMLAATNLSSPNRMKEYVPGLIEPGKFSVDANYVIADYGNLQSYVVAVPAPLKTVTIHWADPAATTPSVSVFTAYITKVTTDLSLEVQKMTIEGQVIGEPGYTAGT